MSGISLRPSGPTIQEGMGQAPSYGSEIGRATMSADDRDGERCDAGDVAETEPDRILFGKGGCVERRDDGANAVFVRGELLGIYASDDVATRDMFIAVVREQASREDLARAFRVSVATVGRVVTRFNEGGARAVADYGRRGGWTVRSPKLVQRLADLFEKGLGPRAAHAAVAKHASYVTIHAVYREWKASRGATVCGTAFELCRRCDRRGHRYCSEACAAEARRVSVRAATAGTVGPRKDERNIAPPSGSGVPAAGHAWGISLS